MLLVSGDVLFPCGLMKYCFLFIWDGFQSANALRNARVLGRGGGCPLAFFCAGRADCVARSHVVKLIGGFAEKLGSMVIGKRNCVPWRYVGANCADKLGATKSSEPQTDSKVGVGKSSGAFAYPKLR